WGVFGPRYRPLLEPSRSIECGVSLDLALDLAQIDEADVHRARLHEHPVVGATLHPLRPDRTVAALVRAVMPGDLSRQEDHVAMVHLAGVAAHRLARAQAKALDAARVALLDPPRRRSLAGEGRRRDDGRRRCRDRAEGEPLEERAPRLRLRRRPL